MARTTMVVCFIGSWLALACDDGGSSSGGGGQSEGGSTATAPPNAGAPPSSIGGGGSDVTGGAPTDGGAGHGGEPAIGGAGGDESALDALLEPNRFGNGVQVHVFEANIYDASDGQGDFGANDCNFGGSLPAIPTDGFFSSWNTVISDEIVAHGQVVMDMHGHFYGHGYHSTPNWYAPDCTHPSSIGHAELADFFYSAITGEAP